MLKTLTDIIASLGLIDGKVSVMTADQLDEFARNIPDKKISCNVFGIGGYSRNDADVLTKTVRICLLKQMPVNYDLATVDLAEAEMSTKLLAIMDALDDSPFVNAENQTAITPELLTYDRTTLLVYLDVDLFGNTSVCGDNPCVPGFLKEYLDSKLEGYVSDPDYVHTDNNYTDAEKEKLAAYPVTPPDVYPYSLKINKQDSKWVDGWLWIDTGSKTYNKKIDVGYMAINTGTGTEQLKPIIHYPAGLTYLVASIPNGFYLKDEDGRLSENTDFEFIDVRYNILNDTVAKYDGLTKLIGGNAAFDDFDVSHSAVMRTIFLQIYEGFTGEVYRAATDILCNNTRIDAHFEPTYARIRNLDIIGIPIVNGASTEQSGSNPDILKISSHYNNTFARKDITANEITFFNNVIAVGSCSDMESPTTGTSFGYGVEFFEDTARTAQEYPNFGSYGNSQSASTAIITAKFKIIKDTTGASWSIVRKAARITARKTVGGIYAAGFPWDMYRGFGIIHVDAAIQYIKNNYTENADYLTALSDDIERTRGIDPMLPFENISKNTPVPKGKMHEVTENNYTDEDKAKLDAYPVLTGIASDGFVNAAGEIQQIAAAVGGFANNLYFSNADSDVAGYKTLTYDLPPTETVISQAVSSVDGDVLVESHLYPDPISADILPAGLWSFEFYGRVSSTVGTTQIGVRYFRYTSSNEKVYLFPAIVWSNAINNTVNNWIPILVQQPSFSVQTGDRMGCDIFVKSTSVVARTVYYILGDGYASYLNNPNAVRHRILRAKNEELAYQHLDATTEKTTPIDADSVGLWDSVAAKFVKTTLNDIKAFLKTYFDSLYVAKVTGSSLITDTEKTRLSKVKTLISDTTYENVWIETAISVDHVTGIFTMIGHGFTDTEAIEFRANTGVLPTGIESYNSDLVTGTYYNVINKTNDTFQICATVGGSTAVIPSDAGISGFQVRKLVSATGVVNLPSLAAYDNEIEVFLSIKTARKAAGNHSFAFRTNGDASAKHIGFGSSLTSFIPSAAYTLKYGLQNVTLKIRRISATECTVEVVSSLINTDNKVSFTSVVCTNGVVNVVGLSAEISTISLLRNAGVEIIRSVRAIITS